MTTGHNDWGNDSCESVESFDVCPKCVTEFYAEYVERCSDRRNSEYIEIEHCYGVTLPLDEEGAYIGKELVVSASICKGHIFKNYMMKEQATSIFGKKCMGDQDDKKRD